MRVTTYSYNCMHEIHKSWFVLNNSYYNSHCTFISNESLSLRSIGRSNNDTVKQLCEYV